MHALSSAGVPAVGAGLLARVASISRWAPQSIRAPLQDGKGPRGCLRMAAPALRVGSPRLQLLAEVSIRPSRCCSGLWGLVCLSIFVLLQINSKPSSQLVSQMDLSSAGSLVSQQLQGHQAQRSRSGDSGPAGARGLHRHGGDGRGGLEGGLRSATDALEAQTPTGLASALATTRARIWNPGCEARAFPRGQRVAEQTPTPTGGWMCRHVGSVVTGGVRAVKARAGVQPLP